MKISRSELRERVRKILVGTLLDEGEKVSVNLLDTVIKYYFLKSEMVTDDEKKFLEESYVDLIGRKEREKIKEEIDIERIKKIVSAFSLSKKSSLLEEFPFEKDLRIFDNVEKIYLFYTKETENKFNEYKKNCKFKEKIEGIEIDGRTVDEIYKKLKELILKNEVNKENTVLDMTLGMKTISIAFYRIAVERQIKAINWNEKFLSSYTQISENEFKENEEGPTPRIALSAKLSLMREPIKESLGIYSRINVNIKKGNYEVVSDFYKIIGIDDMAFFYKELNKFVKFALFEKKYESFYEKIEEVIKNIFNYSQYDLENKRKIRSTVIFFIKLVYYYNYCKDKKEINWINFHKNNFDLKFLEIVEDYNFEDFNEKNQEKYFQYLNDKYYCLRNEGEVLEVSAEDILYFNIEEELLEEIEEYKLKYKNRVLTIPNYELENYKIKIDLSKMIKESNTRDIPIIKLLEGMEKNDYSISSNEVKENLVSGIGEEGIKKVQFKKKYEEYKNGEIKLSELLNFIKYRVNTENDLEKLMKSFKNKSNENSQTIRREYEKYKNGKITFEELKNKDEFKYKKYQNVNTEKDVEKLIEDIKNLKDKNFNSMYGKMKKNIDKINQKIKEIMSEKGIKVGNFIEYSKEVKNYSIRISEKFIV